MVGKSWQGQSALLALTAAVAAAAVASVVLAAGAAAAGDVSNSPWAVTSNDSALANYVSAPGASRPYQGTTGPSSNLFASSFATSAVAFNLQSAIVEAGIQSAEFPTPWAFVGRATIGLAGTYIAYKVGSWWDHWRLSQWGGNVTGNLAATTYHLVAAGSQCAWYDVTLGRLYNITWPTRGYVAWDDSAQGAFDYCYSSGGGPLITNGYKVQSNGQDLLESPSDADANLGSRTAVRGSDGYTYYVWFQPVASGATPAGAQANDIEPYAGQPTPNGDLTSHMGTPSASAMANALRNQITGPTDTCLGAPCVWGSSATDQASATTMQNVFDCLLASCPTDALAPSFEMPDCYGMTPADCDSAMTAIGFTGTSTTADVPLSSADFTQPVGVVLTTDPAAGAQVSTDTATEVAEQTNPAGCGWNVQNPHISTGTN